MRDTTFHPRRRRILQGMLGAGALAIAGRHAAAQSGAALHTLPRHALVIGNSSYKDVPLKNPANDARALAEELKGTGFEVVVRLDAGRDEMLKEIQAYGRYLAQRKAIGLFYFAGHGAQLAWRNYLIPVDVVIDTLDDVRTRAVELNLLLQGLTRAQNPMNVIILDACRDNPFGKRVPVEQKGLSQFDAPPGSLLAYATSPGNVANDGEGANGLYTENLLRELKTPEAKIEDVFKRVRLAVRRRSSGQQIPWESTSLEEDFYFRPPKELKKLSEAEDDRRFGEERALWEKIREANDPRPLEDYLRGYPSGRFSELAQLRLDQVLARQGERKIEIVTDVKNPYTKGAAAAGIDYKIGDRYVYRVFDQLTKLELKRTNETVTAVTDTEVIYNDGRMTTDLLGNYNRDDRGRLLTASQYFVSEYSIGKKWKTRFILTRQNGTTDDVELDFRVTGRESFTVAAGTFDAWRVEGQGYVRGVGANWKYVYWIAPDRVRRFLAIEYVNRGRLGRLLANDRYELVSFQQ